MLDQMNVFIKGRLQRGSLKPIIQRGYSNILSQNIIKMQKIDKNKDPFMFLIQFNYVRNFKSWPFVYIPLIFVSAILYSLKLYELIHPGHNPYPGVPYFTVFIAQIVLLSAVIIIGVICLCINSANNIFAYCLLLTQSLGLFFVQTTMECFEKSQWCQGQIKYQTGAILILFIYALLVWLRSTLYYPFYDNYNYISMSSSSIVLFDFVYKFLLGLITNLSFIQSIQSQRKFIILTTIILYCIFNSTTYYSNPLIYNLWLVVNTFVVWSAVIIYLLPYFNVISTMINTYDQQTQKLFWYIWGYSTPCLICYVIICNFSVDGKNGWKTLFLQKKHEIKSLNHLYLMMSQFKEKLKYARKSEQKANDPLFKTIWALIQKHNQFCDHIECPLGQLKNMQINRNDDHLQQKRLGKTIQSCYQFGLYHLQRKKDRFPNLLQLSIQIANYQLEVFQNRQKGLLLCTQFYTKSDIDQNQKFTLFYLKKKIQVLFIDNEHYTKINTQNQISQFRHNIQVSVSMLAEFWYFLADPKCNLKKLYDLANVLFPLKIGVDNQWKNIQKLKNIQSYNLYARYLIKMFNDKDKGLKIIEEAKKIQHQLKNRQQVQFDVQGNSNISAQQYGIILLEYDGKSPGVMYQVNLAAERIFGYNKGELVNRKVNDIMPRLFANHHDKILQNYQQTNKPRMMNKQRAVWGKSKDGYLFPFIINIKPVKNLLSNSSQVYASIKRQTWVKQSAFLTLDNQDQINQVSSAMLGIYPQMYGKVNLKKKMHITEIIPNFAQLKQQMKEDGQGTCQTKVCRQFYVSPKQKFEQTTTFNLSMVDLYIEVAGYIGHVLTFQKTLAANLARDLGLSNLNQSRLSNINLGLSNFNQSRMKENNFRFIYQIMQSQTLEEQQDQSTEQNQKRALLKYKGGVVHDVDQMAKSCINQASRFFTKLPIQEEKRIQERKTIDYADGIKTKRLQGKIVREIHIISEESEYDIAQIQKQMQESLGVGNIKPSQLSSILEKETSNKHIFCLKVLTLTILLASSLLCIVQYINIQLHHTTMMDSNQKVRKLNQLGSQILYMKMYTTQFSSNLRTLDQLQMLTEQINQLDEYLDLYAYNSETRLVYSDGSGETMIMAFALNKLMSEANSMKSAATIYNQSESHVHFLNHNTINGLIIAARQEAHLALEAYSQSLQQITTIQMAYLGVSLALFLIAMLAKNILLRTVLKKKSQILQVFFEIPRKTCTSIQKQCQRFIQRLSTQNQQDLESLSMASERSEAGFTQQKKHYKQKKRTVMGEQKTTNNYMLATGAFLLTLVSFHVFVTIFHTLNKQTLEFSMHASEMVFRVQQQVSLATNLINSYALNQRIPLMSRGLDQSLSVIEQQFQSFSSLYGDIAVKFYLIGNILDKDYLASYNLLQYEDLCALTGKPAAKCDTFYGENYGLNVILSQYFNLVKDKYLQLKAYYANDQVIDSAQKAAILKNDRLQSQRKVQYLLKQHWRQLTKVLKNGLDRLISKNDTIIFALMLTMCIANFTILLFCWLKFYHSLQQKIAATQYILTFIPIDEINMNPKIANYIREQILEKR